MAASTDAEPPASTAEFGDALSAVVGSPGGAALRRALNDVDSRDIARTLTSPEGAALRRTIRRQAASQLCAALDRSVWRGAAPAAPSAAAAPVAKGGFALASGARPSNAAADRLRARQLRWQRKSTQVILWSRPLHDITLHDIT